MEVGSYNKGEIELLQKVNKVLYDGIELVEIYRIIAKGLTDILHYNSSGIYLLDESGRNLTCVGYSADSKIVEQMEKLTGISPLNYTYPLIKGSVMARIIESGEPLVTDDLEGVVKSHSHEKKVHRLAGTLVKISGAKWGLGVPLIARERIIGVIGVGSKKKLTDQDIVSLASFGVQIGIALEVNGLIKDLEVEVSQRERTEKILLHILNGLDAIVYVADMKTMELLFVNKYMEDIFGDVRGQICWKTIQAGQEGPCPFCTNDLLIDKYGRPTGPYRWEFQNTRNGRWYDIIDRAIQWVDGRIVRLEIAYDVTERKEKENEIRERGHIAELGSEVGRALTKGGDIDSMLGSCCQAMVNHLGAAFARIWTYDEERDLLQLKASAGIYTHIDGEHASIRMGQYKIGLIAKTRQPVLTNSVIGDPRVHDQVWAEKEGMQAFAGHPLIIGDRLVGVMALFSRNTLSEITQTALESIADEIALGIDHYNYSTHLEEMLTFRTKELSFQKKLLEKVSEGIEERILLLDRDLRIEWVNHTFKKETGFEDDEVIGKHCFEVTHGQSIKCTAPDDLCPIDRVLNTGESASEVHRHYDGKGHLQQVEVTAYPLFEDGELTGYVHLSRDVTEKKRIEDEIRSLKSFNENIVQTMEEGILIQNDEGVITYANPRMVDMIGRSQDSLQGRDIRDIFTPDSLNILETSEEGLQKGEKQRFEAFLSRKEGILPVLVSASPLFEGGFYAGNLKVFIDISDQKEAEHRLKEKALKYRIKGGNSYIIFEKELALGLDVFRDLLGAGYEGIILSRKKPEDFHIRTEKALTVFWLSEKGKGRTIIPPDLNILKKKMEDHITPNSSVLLDRLDYLIVQCGFEEVLRFLQELNEFIYLSRSILIVVVDPETMDKSQVSLLEKEFERVEVKNIVRLEEPLYELLEFISRENREGKLPAHKDLEARFNITRPTAIKRINALKAKGLIRNQRRGRFKVLELTDLGKNIL